MVKSKKAQIMGEVFKYALVGVVSIVILIAGYGLINVVRERACMTEISKFQIDLKNIDKSLRFGEKELRNYDAPCKVDKIYFFNLNKNTDIDTFKDIPIIKDSITSGSNNNVFLVEGSNVKSSFYAGNLEILYPYNICFVPKFGKISFFAEGAGKSAKVRSACNQPECTLIPINIDEKLSRKIIQEAIDFGCRHCPTDLEAETQKIKLTRQNVEIFRRFLYCDGVTDIQIIIRPKKGSNVGDFTFYEFLPKDCIDDLRKYLAEDIGGEVDIRGDPLIIWHFSNLGDEKKISYKLSTEISEECKQAIKGLGVAQVVQQKENVDVPASGRNRILRLKSFSEELKGEGKKLEKNLWDSTDYNGNKESLVYSIISQNTNLVKCEIKNEKNLECGRKGDGEGISEVLIEVSDGALTNRGTLSITVGSKGSESERQESSSRKCKNDETCGFLKFGKCKNEKCCEVDLLNPFC